MTIRSPAPDAAPSETAGGGLAALIASAEGHGKGLPPVEKWNPDFCGDIDMVIRADGTWVHEGSPIGRKRLVRLFSTVLRRDEDGETYLVTPVEKLRVTVEDAPFLAVEMQADIRDGVPTLVFRTNVGDVVEAGPDHPLRFEREEGTDGVKPYLHVRGRLEALVNRAVTYDLIERAEEVDGQLVVSSNGATFAVG